MAKETISRTCYIERSKVREIILSHTPHGGILHDLLLKIDALPILTQEEIVPVHRDGPATRPGGDFELEDGRPAK